VLRPLELHFHLRVGIVNGVGLNWGMGSRPGLFSGVKRPKCEADHSRAPIG
jgi:hypothetical protein